VWFQGIRWIDKIVQPGQAFIAFGKPNLYNSTVSIVHPELELYNPKAKKTGNLRLQPVYSSTEKLKQYSLDSKGIQRLTAELMPLIPVEIEETLPEYILQKHKLTSRKDAFWNIHFPAGTAELEAARRRLKFEELFAIQLKLLKNKLLRTQKFKGQIFEKV